MDPEENDRPVAVRDGVEYLKINTAELFFMLRETPEALAGRPILIRGVAQQTPELGGPWPFRPAAHQFHLLRGRCHGHGGSPCPRRRASNRPAAKWVRVFGQLKPRPSGEAPVAPPSVGGVFLSTLAKDFILVADRRGKGRSAALPLCL